MSPEAVLDIGREAMYLALLLSTPLLLSALIIGLLVGILQAATQIQEMTLSFIPKLLALALALLMAGPWMIDLFVSFTRRLFTSIPALVG
jgi:flagellar biosynthetic protein FliQ